MPSLRRSHLDTSQSFSLGALWPAAFLSNGCGLGDLPLRVCLFELSPVLGIMFSNTRRSSFTRDWFLMESQSFCAFKRYPLGEERRDLKSVGACRTRECDTSVSLGVAAAAAAMPTFVLSLIYFSVAWSTRLYGRFQGGFRSRSLLEPRESRSRWIGLR